MSDTTAPKRNIFDIDANLDQLAQGFDNLDEAGVEETVKAQVMAWFGDRLAERDGKLDKYAHFIRSRESRAVILKAEYDRLNALSKTAENEAKKLKTWLQIFLESKGLARIETALHKFWIQKNGGAVPIVESEDIDFAVLYRRQPKFVKAEFELDKEAVRAELLRLESLVQEGLDKCRERYAAVGHDAEFTANLLAKDEESLRAEHSLSFAAFGTVSSGVRIK